MANNNSDSLKTALRFENNDTVKVKILIQLAEIQKEYSYWNSIKYAENALDLSQRLKSQESEANALRILGTVNWSSSNYEKSREYLWKAIQIFDNLQDSSYKARCLNTVGLSYYYQASYSIAIQNLSNSLEIFTSLKDSAQISRVSNNLALVYDASGQFELANKYFISGLNHELNYRAIYDQFLSDTKRQERIYKNERIANVFIPKLREKIYTSKLEGDFYETASSASKIGGFYNMLSQPDSALHYFLMAGNVYDSINEPAKYALELLDIAKLYSKLGKNKQAKEYFNLTLPILIQEQMNPTIGSWHIHLGDHVTRLGSYMEAIHIFESGLAHSDSLGHLASSAKYHKLISEIYHSLPDLSKAIRHGQISLQIAEEIGSFTRRKEAIESLYLSYRASGDLAKAIQYQEELHEMIQLKENASMQRASQEYEAKFEHQIQARKIDALTKENQLKDSKLNSQLTVIYFSILFVATIIIFLIILRKRYRNTSFLNEKITRQNISLSVKNDENELLMKEIHHRVKNNLQIVSNILNLQKRKTDNQEAKMILDHTKSRIKVMGLIHEHLYKTDNIDLISLDKYIPDLVNRLISTMHDGNKITAEYDVFSGKIDLDSTIYIGLITHEIVINAIKYAFDNHTEPFLKIKVLFEKGNIIMNFCDNGPGMQHDMNGFGSTIIQTIVNGMQGTINYRNDNGLNVTIELKGISVAEK